MKPEDITNDQIRQIGIAYLSAYSPTSWSAFFKIHTNQLQAESLKNFAGRETAQQRWEFLVSVYSQLPKPMGHLADRMDDLLNDAFGFVPTKFIAGGSGGTYYHSTYLVVKEIESYIKHYFKDLIELRSIAFSH